MPATIVAPAAMALFEDGVRILYGQDHSHGASAQGFRTRFLVIGDPELRPVNRQLGHDLARLVGEEMELRRTERGAVVLERLGASADGQPRRNARPTRLHRRTLPRRGVLRVTQAGD